MRCCVIIQARLGSARLPAKLALDLGGATLLQRVIQRVALASGPNDIIVATSKWPQDDITADIAETAGVATFRGALEDARDRFIRAAHWCKADVLIRVTADNPFVEPSYIEDLIRQKQENVSLPYAVHDLSKVVHGSASELVDVQALEQAICDTSAKSEKEHITPAIRNRVDGVTLAPLPQLADSELSLSVDTIEDYISAQRVFRRFGGGREALASIVAAYRSCSPDSDFFRRRESNRAC